jgi:hypothetical protein
MNFFNKKSANRPQKNYKETINEILSVSTLQFLLSPIRSKRLLIKITWALFLVVLFLLSIYYAVLNILDYLKFETFTSYHEINENQSEFPTISLCSADYKDYDLKLYEIRFNKSYDFSGDMKKELEENFEMYIDTNYGKCYRFNSGKNMLNQSIPIKYAKLAGKEARFRIKFQIISNNKTSDYETFLIYIHNSTMIPLSIYRLGYYISVGTSSHFIIKRTFNQKLEQPFNDCYKNVSSFGLNQTIIDFIRFNNRSYTQKECLHLCLIDDENRNIDNFYINVDRNRCLQDYCPLECDSFSYDILTNSYDQNPKNSSNYTIGVYYEDLKYTLISQQPKIELFGLISNIGGTLGLFIGFSFITLLEIFELLAELMFIFFSS